MSRYLYLRFFSFFRNKTFWLLEIEMLEYRFYLAEIFVKKERLRVNKLALGKNLLKTWLL